MRGRRAALWTASALVVVLSCEPRPRGLTAAEFRQLLESVARGWSTRDTELALSSFHPDAVYMEPPDLQYYRGHDQLGPYFDALEDRHSMVFHQIWFDEASQSGAAEYTFSGGGEVSDVGVAVVQLRDGKIWFWREYQRKGPTDFQEFLRVEGKEWEWHIGNYP